MYNADDLITTLHQQPYQPVELLLSSGERIKLTHPEQAVVTDTDAVLVVLPGQREGRHSWRLIGLDHIVSFNSTSPAPTDDPQDNGR